MTQRITAQQIATAHAVLKSYGYFVDHSALGEALQAALGQAPPTAQTESTGRPESIRLNMGGMYFGD